MLELKRSLDISDAPQLYLSEKEFCAARLAMVVQLTQIVAKQGAVTIMTPTALDLFNDMANVYKNHLERLYNDLHTREQMARSELLDKIDNLENEIENMKRREQVRKSRTRTEVQVQEERQTPIPDHASGTHD